MMTAVYIVLAILPVVFMVKLIIYIDDRMIADNEARKRSLYKRAPYLKPKEGDDE